MERNRTVVRVGFRTPVCSIQQHEDACCDLYFKKDNEHVECVLCKRVFLIMENNMVEASNHDFIKWSIDAADTDKS